MYVFVYDVKCKAAVTAYMYAFVKARRKFTLKIQ